MFLPRLLLFSLTTALLAVNGVAVAADDVSSTSPVMTCPLNDFGHLDFGRIIPIHGEEHRCLMWWPGEDAIVWKKYWGELVPTEERFSLSADEVLYIDQGRIVTKTGESQIDVFDRETMESLDQTLNCQQFCGWIDEALWVGVGYRDRIPELVVRNIQQDDEFRISLGAWMGYETTPLFMDVDDNIVTCGFDLGQHPDDASRTTHSSVAICRIDLTTRALLWQHMQASLPGELLCITNLKLPADNLAASFDERHLATKDGLFRMSYNADGIVLVPVLLTAMQHAVFDSSSDSICFSRGNDFWRLRWRSGAIELAEPRQVRQRIDDVVALFDGTIIVRNYLQLFAFNEHQTSYHEAIDRVTSLLFSPNGEQLAVMGMTNTTLFSVSDTGLGRDSRQGGHEVAAFTAEGTQIVFEYNVNLNGVGLTTLNHVAEVWPDGKTSEWYPDPAQRDDRSPLPYNLNREPFFSPDGRHAFLPYLDTLLDAQGAHLLDIPKSVIQRLTDSLAGGVFLLSIENEMGDTSLCVVNADDYSVHEIDPQVAERGWLSSPVLFDDEHLLGFLHDWDAPRDAPELLVTVSLDGEVVPVGNRAWPRVDYAIHTTLDRNYVAFLTTDGLVRLKTDSWESETFSIPGFTDLDQWTASTLVWELTPQGDGVAWVKDATLYFTRFQTSE